METIEPKRKIVRSNGALYVLLLLLVIGVITAGNLLSERWDLPRAIVQITLYVLLLVLGWAVYRYCLTSFRYTLTDRLLSVERVVGRKERADECVHLSDITRIGPYDKERETGRRARRLYVNGRKDALAVHVRGAGGGRTLLINPGAEFREKLVSQWKSART